MTRAFATWAGWSALAALVIVLVEWTDRPPPPVARDAPAAAFSEERAEPVVVHLAGDLGRRMAGSPEQAQAAEYLAGLLRGIPGVEVAIEDTTGSRLSPFFKVPVLFSTRNVIARLPGDETQAVLVSAHYDSGTEGPGAGDNAVAVAAAVEVVRALAVGPRLRHTVIFNFNGAEEPGLFGAAGAALRPWIRDVRVFVNLDAAGTHGKAILFQAGPGNAWLVRAYARSVPHPYGSVIGQDIFQSGVLPSATDFEVYRDDAGLRGLDLALFQDSYAYHTPLDRVERVEPGSLQHVGSTTLALVRELAGGDLPGDTGGEPGVYYDVLGLTMVAYPAGTARLLAALALILAAAAVLLARWRRVLRLRDLLVAAGITVVSFAGGLLLAVAVSLALPLLLHRPHGWYATPWLGVLAFGAVALAGLTAVQALWSRVSARRGTTPEARFFAAQAGVLLFWSVALAVLTRAGIGSAYLPLWWVVSGALGLSVCSLSPAAWRPWVLAAASVPAAVVTLQMGSLLIKLFVPSAGRMPLGIPFDPVVAVLAALPVLAWALAAAPTLQLAGRLGRLALALALIGLVALVALSLREPYSAERPKRIYVEHREEPGGSVLVLAGLDFPDARAAFKAVPGARVSARDFGFAARPLYETDAPPAELPTSQVSAVSSTFDPATNARRLALRFEPRGAGRIEVKLARDRLRGCSVARPLPPPGQPGAPFVFWLVAPPEAGVEVELELAGPDPVELGVKEVRNVATPAAQAVRDKLPGWTTAALFATRTWAARF